MKSGRTRSRSLRRAPVAAQSHGETVVFLRHSPTRPDPAPTRSCSSRCPFRPRRCCLANVLRCRSPGTHAVPYKRFCVANLSTGSLLGCQFVSRRLMELAC
ncbi:hypothetical protein [Lysobacter gummosus]|uniref:hypothetical protein n=1 Tax=Lysobacter gummosus TaxID=262324 RepID=UPI0036309BEE